MGILVVIGQVAGVVGAINQVATILNKPRSVILQISNRTNHILNFLSDDHMHGDYAMPPDQQIPPGNAEIFGAQSRAWSLGTGTEGTVTYGCNEFDITIYWNNPFIATFWEGKSNSASVSLGGPQAGLYSATAIAGAGDQNAHMLYEVFPTTAAPLDLTNGSMMRELNSDPVYVIFGGAKFWLSTSEWVTTYGGWSAVKVVANGILAGVPNIPADGTVLKEWSDPRVYVIQASQKSWIPSPERFGHLGLDWSNVLVVPDGGLAQIPDGPNA